MSRQQVFDDLVSFEEIAERLHLRSKQHAHQIYNRAMRKLRRYYNDPAHREELRQLLQPDPEDPGWIHDDERHLKFPEVFEWNISPSPGSPAWRTRALRALENL
jgi:hypothetical protein